MNQYLFIYGTLRPDLAPGEITRVVETLKPVGEGSVRGLLYDLGDYPGALIDVSCERKIFGSVFQLPEEPAALHAFDSYEGFNPRSIADSLFVREQHAVELADGRELRCWIYIYNLEPAGARIVEDGRYKKVD